MGAERNRRRSSPLSKSCSEVLPQPEGPAMATRLPGEMRQRRTLNSFNADRAGVAAGP